ncbi:MAG: dTDP-4-dehydrorhamnose 3,5-epimerase [Crocinitomicaceae bacterium]|nr:dTDP-4-dehydrorhamnose 3,5-epimerase [Crocinitomicaceae bacterium]
MEIITQKRRKPKKFGNFGENLSVEFNTYEIEGLVSFKSKVFGDSRGYFFESYNKQQLLPILGDLEFVQDNQSLSQKGVLRGLHFQKPPYAQGKLVRVIKGAALDVAVDIREGSPTYGQYVKVLLSESNFMNFWIPPGFAHGFLAMEDDTIFSYKCTEFYNADSEDALLWNDPDINIDWGVDNPIISEKDNEAQPLNLFKSPFKL